jgi:uncharacterized membrane protein HdeD (DUF308 family)
MTGQAPRVVMPRVSTWSIVWGVMLIVFGILAIASPFLAAVAVSALIAWLIILAGLAHFILAFDVHRGGGPVWKLLVGPVYVLFGTYLLMRPVLGVASLTLLVALLFLVEGVLDVVLFVHIRSERGSAWVLLDGITTLVLALLIYLGWPSCSVWAIGTLVGVSMIISGLTRVLLFSTRRLAAAAA